jgi:hypothetical protein
LNLGLSRAGAAAVLLLAGAVPALAQAPPVTVTVSGRMHYQWNTTSVDAAEAGAVAPIASNTFETRRVRLGVDVRVSDWITGRIEPEYTLGRLAVRQVWMAFQVDSGTVVRAGQVKKPFGLFMLTSSGQLNVIERGVRVRGLDDMLQRGAGVRALRGEALSGEHHSLLDVQRYSGYDMGLQLEQRLGPLHGTVGVYNGTGPDLRDENDGKSLAARLAWRAPVATPLTLGAGWSQRELNWPAAGGAEVRRGNAFAVDAELGGFRRGVWLLAEAATGENLVTEERFAGAQAALSCFRATGGRRVEGVEPLARVSWGDPDRAVADDGGVLLTPGVNVYFHARNRLMLNWDVYLPQASGVATQHAARAQVNLHF